MGAASEDGGGGSFNHPFPNPADPLGLRGRFVARERPETAAATGPAAAPSDPGPRVLFIAGTGRSGSTLLDRLLGSVPGMFSGGELSLVWQFGIGENRPCSCGQLFRDCPFYRKVMQEAFGEPAVVDLPALQEARRRILPRWRNAVLIRTGRLTSRQRGAVKELADFQAKLYRGIARVSGASVILDSSKHPILGLVSRPVVEDFRVVHLVRDSRGPAYSWQRVKWEPKREGQSGTMPRHPAIEAAWGWMGSNLLTELTLRRRGRYLRISYESLTAAPEHVLRRVLDFAGVAEEVPSRGPGGGFEAAPMHMASGNPIRFDTGEIAVREDTEWRTAMGWRDKALVTALTLPGLVRYGYVGPRGRRHGGR